MIKLGVDVGGTSIRSVLVHPTDGSFLSDIFTTPTPPKCSVSEFFAILEEHHAYASTVRSDFSVALAIPGVIRNGSVYSHANLGEDWYGVNIVSETEQLFHTPATAVNDADAAVLAEIHYGRIDLDNSPVLFTLFGTGIGTALYHNRVLFPNTELGHVDIAGIVDYEKHVSPTLISQGVITFNEWVERVNVYFAYIEGVLHPETIIIGGGISEQFSEYAHLIETQATLLQATHHKHSGLIGSTLA